MEWICSCNYLNEDVEKCQNCGLNMPYSAVELSINGTEINGTTKRPSWYLFLAKNRFDEADEYKKETESIEERKQGSSPTENSNLNNQIYSLSTDALKLYNKCLEYIETSENLNPNIQIMINNETISGRSLKIGSYINKGIIFYKREEFDEALNNYSKSNDVISNQIALYSIAMAKRKIDVDVGLFSGAKKREVAEKERSEGIVGALKKAVDINPYSELGIEAGRILIEEYLVDDFKL